MTTGPTVRPRPTGSAGVRRLAAAVLVAAGLLAPSPARAEIGVLVLADGTRLMGHVAPTADGYSVTRGQQVDQVPKAQVKQVLKAADLRAEFDKRRAAADAKQPLALAGVAVWAQDNGLLDEADAVVAEILKLQPDSAIGKQVAAKTAELRAVLYPPAAPAAPAAPPAPAEPPPAPPADTPAPPPGDVGALPPEAPAPPPADGAAPPPADAPPADAPPAVPDSAVPVADATAGPASKPAVVIVRQPLPLTREEINRVRLHEVYTGEKGKPDQVTVVFRNNLLDRFYQKVEGEPGFKTAADKAAFRKQPPAEQLRIILRKLDPATLKDFEKDIEINTDPPPLMTFRTKVYPFIAENCATSACHGKDNAPGFSWIASASPNPGQYLANFLELEARAYGTRSMSLVDRERPDESLVLHYALPASLTEFKHPAVPGWPRPGVTTSTPGYVDTLNWIKKELKYPPKPDYGITLRRQGQPAGGEAPGTAPPAP